MIGDGMALCATIRLGMRFAWRSIVSANHATTLMRRRSPGAIGPIFAVMRCLRAVRKLGHS
jgi:hypothetical protein